jgi:hypothetical protein
MATQQTRDKMSKAHTGKHHTEETKEKLRSIAHAYSKRCPMSQSTKDKISSALRGKHLKEETKQKIRESLLAYEELRKQGLIPRFHHTPETKEKLRKLAAGKRPSAQCIAASVAARKEKAFQKKMKHLKTIGFFN